MLGVVPAAARGVAVDGDLAGGQGAWVARAEDTGLLAAPSDRFGMFRPEINSVRGREGEEVLEMELRSRLEPHPVAKP